MFGGPAWTVFKKEVLLVEEIFQYIGNLGFPIAVTAFLLVRIESKLDDLTASIAELARTIAAGRSSK